uniref:L,D-transpeptidase family protein n=1 Tax=Edaphosphingomonas laterariae TaxID=861865 RepID=UPI001FE2FA0A|nr:L,D-transpeptidase family protein [Sphingomonas laterariae]
MAAAVKSSVGGKYKAFYRARNYWPIWVHDGVIGPEADRLIDYLESADVDGLDPSDYDPESLREDVAAAREGSASAVARMELRLSRAFVAYVRDMRSKPRVDMVYLDAELQPEKASEVAILRSAAVAPSLAAYMDAMGWMSPFYGELRAKLADYRTNWGGLPLIAIGPGDKLRPGSRGERVRLLRARLDLTDGEAFDKALAQKVKAFQAAHGLGADGVVGDATTAALDRSPQYYEERIRLNLERARVLPATRKRHIIVDAAAARLWMYEDGAVKDTMRVIVGKPTEQTPMLAGMMRYAVVNPYWNVPEDLVQRRIAPKIVEQGATLDGLGYEALSDWTAQASVLQETAIDWSAVAAGQQEVRVRQLPGKSNAMGRIKFMFPNDLGIYLHDTPDKALFREKERRFSSGCVRVEDAARLAVWLFGKHVEAETDDPEQQVMLAEAVPVYLTYFTVAPTAKGITFRDDPYGRDEGKLEQFAVR